METRKLDRNSQFSLRFIKNFESIQFWMCFCVQFIPWKFFAWNISIDVDEKLVAGRAYTNFQWDKSASYKIPGVLKWSETLVT